MNEEEVRRIVREEIALERKRPLVKLEHGKDGFLEVVPWSEEDDRFADEFMRELRSQNGIET